MLFCSAQICTILAVGVQETVKILRDDMNSTLCKLHTRVTAGARADMHVVGAKVSSVDDKVTDVGDIVSRLATVDLNHAQQHIQQHLAAVPDAEQIAEGRADAEEEYKASQQALSDEELASVGQAAAQLLSSVSDRHDLCEQLATTSNTIDDETERLQKEAWRDLESLAQHLAQQLHTGVSALTSVNDIFEALRM